MTDRHPPLTHFAWLAVAAGVLTIGLKAGSYLLTGSVGLLSDATCASLVEGVACDAPRMIPGKSRSSSQEGAP